MDMTGEQVLEALGYAASIKQGHGAFLHVSGVRWTTNKGKAENVMVGGLPIELDKKYRVVTNSFMAAGGDGYTMLKRIQQLDTGFVDADSLREYIASLGSVEPRIEGRLTIVD
jgi:5'-nucleotidase/UDP-sugar diphosphatase